jgi:hypothetical protein
MMNLRDEIPKRASMNAEIVQHVITTQVFGEAIEAIQQKYGIQEYQFMNQAYVVSLLYCLLVVPKELWLGKERKQGIYQELDKWEPLRNFDLEITNHEFAQDPTYHLIHGLRNSIAHARFSVNNSLQFTFWDQRPGASAPHFQVTASSSNLMAFPSEIGSLLANL